MYGGQSSLKLIGLLTELGNKFLSCLEPKDPLVCSQQPVAGLHLRDMHRAHTILVSTLRFITRRLLLGFLNTSCSLLSCPINVRLDSPQFISLTCLHGEAAHLTVTLFSILVFLCASAFSTNTLHCIPFSNTISLRSYSSCGDRSGQDVQTTNQHIQTLKLNSPHVRSCVSVRETSHILFIDFCTTPSTK